MYVPYSEETKVPIKKVPHFFPLPNAHYPTFLKINT